MSRRLSVLLTGLLLAGLASAPHAAVAGGTAPGSSAATSGTAPGARTAALSTAQFETRLIALTNARRAKVGCRALRTNLALISAARRHTDRMIATGSFSHQVPREAGLASRIVRAGYTPWRALAENIAWGGGQTPATMFSMWMHSAPHRANIQNCALRDIGYGVRYGGGAVWATADFGRH
ncbi:MAG: CAP domain-containing protein [Marmoricola sp.]